MATTNTWSQVVEKISGVANRGAFSKTFTPTTSSQSASGAAGYYSSVSTTCNAVSLSGNAGVGQVLTGYTFYNNSLTRQTGTMANRGALNWNPSSSTTYSVSAGYYSGGTLNSSGAYNAGVTAADNRANANSTNYKTGYNAGYSAGAAATRTIKSKAMSVTSSSATKAFVDNDKSNGGTTNAYYLTVSPGLTAYTITYIGWNANNKYMNVGCTGSAGNVGFALTVHHLAATDNTAKNLNCQYSGGTFYLPVPSKSTTYSVIFYYV